MASLLSLSTLTSAESAAIKQFHIAYIDLEEVFSSQVVSNKIDSLREDFEKSMAVLCENLAIAMAEERRWSAIKAVASESLSEGMDLLEIKEMQSSRKLEPSPKNKQKQQKQKHHHQQRRH